MATLIDGTPILDAWSGTSWHRTLPDPDLTGHMVEMTIVSQTIPTSMPESLEESIAPTRMLRRLGFGPMRERAPTKHGYGPLADAWTTLLLASPTLPPLAYTTGFALGQGHTIIAADKPLAFPPRELQSGRVSTIVRAMSVGLTESEPDAYVSPTYAAFKDLVEWLPLSAEQVADIVGVGRTTPSSWQRDRREPRAETVRRLYQHHAVLAALVKHGGKDETQRWLVRGDPSPLALLRQGDLEAVDRRAYDSLFRGAAPSTAPGSYIPDEEPDVPPSRLAAAMRAGASGR